jgi:hypothetical protein
MKRLFLLMFTLFLAVGVASTAFSATLFGKVFTVDPVIFAAIVSGICWLVTQVVTKWWGKIPSKFAPYISVLIGILTYLADGLVAGTVTSLSSALQLTLSGLMTGLFTSGAYSSGKLTLQIVAPKWLEAVGVQKKD